MSKGFAETIKVELIHLSKQEYKRRIIMKLVRKRIKVSLRRDNQFSNDEINSINMREIDCV